VSRDDLVALADAPQGPTASIMLPTHRRGAEIRQGPVRLRTLVARARSALTEDEHLPADLADALLAPVRALAEDYRFWQHQHQDRGLAVYATLDGLRRFHVPVPLPERVTTGTGPFLVPLLPLVEPDPPFLVLTVAEGEVKLFSASRTAFARIETAHDEHDLPRDGTGVLTPPDYENPVQAPPVARPHTASLDISHAQVYGDSPADRRTRARVELTRRVAAAVQRVTARTGRPVVVVAGAKTGGHVTGRLTGSGVEVLGTVELNPTGATEDDLHAAAGAVGAARSDSVREHALALFTALHEQADARARVDPADVLRAAHEGRVETLLVAAGCEVFGRYDVTTGEVSLADDLAGAGGDLLGVAAVRTIVHGGTVHVVDRHRLPGPVGAVLRF